MMKTMKQCLISLLLVMGLSTTALANDSGHLIRASDFRTAPYGNAAQIGILRADTQVEVVQRSGGWYQVELPDGRQGWVRMASVRFADISLDEEQENEGGGWLFGWFDSGRENSRWTTATTGIRGLDEADIQAAQPDYAAVDNLAGFAASKADARGFAADLPLQARKVPIIKGEDE